MRPPPSTTDLGILIVESIHASAVDLAARLRSTGCTDIRIAHDIDSALRLVREHAPDLFFVDIHLASRDDGFEAARQLAEIHPAPVIFISAQTDSDDLRHALRGADVSFAESKLLPPDLLRVINAACRRQPDPREIEALAVTEPQSGLGNTRKLERALWRENKRCQLEGAHLSLLAIDADDTSVIDTRYRGASHDRLVSSIITTLKANCLRQRDEIFRGGPLRFYALLPCTPAPGARHVAQRIIQAIASLPPDAAPFRITASAGVAVAQPDTPEGFLRLLEKADAALISAQSAGGNRIIGGNSAPPPPRPSRIRTWWQSLWKPPEFNTPDRERRRL